MKVSKNTYVSEYLRSTLLIIAMIFNSLQSYSGYVIDCGGINYEVDWSLQSAQVVGRMSRNVYDKECNIADKVWHQTKYVKVTSIADNAFSGDQLYRTVTIPATVNSIGENAFSDCPELCSVALPDNLTEIKKSTFSNCTSLRSLKLPSQLSVIKESAFSNSGLKELEINTNLSTIGKFAFEGCPLQKIKFNCDRGWKSPLLIRDNAFKGSYPQIIILEAEEPPVVAKTAFTDYGATLYVRKEFKSNYTSHPIWSQFASIKEIPDHYDDNEHALLDFNKSEYNLSVGEDCVIPYAVLFSRNGDTEFIDERNELSWESSDSSVAVVKDGNIKALKNGNATLTAYYLYGYKFVKGNIDVTVYSPEIKVSSISFPYENIRLYSGDEKYLNAEILPKEATNKDLFWFTSNSEVAAVEKGCVLAKEPGVATITACTQDGSALSATCVVTVLPMEIIAKSISLNTRSFEGRVGEQIKLLAQVLPENTTDKSVIWSTSDPNIANVDKTGLVTALSIGSATITATCGDVSATCAVSVIPTPVESISFGMMEVTLKPTETVQMDATVSPPTATIKDLVWASSDTSVAIVDRYGLVTAVSAGQCFVTASAGDGSNVSANCVVTVKPVLIESILLDTPGWKGVKGDCFQIIATIAPEDATDKTLIWTSSDESVASVDDTGMVTAVGVGECLITASAADGSGISASCEVSLDPILVESLTISPEEFLGAKGDSFMIIPTILPENADNKRLEYKSGNEGVAEVDSMGSVTVKDNGSAVITVRTTDGSDIEAECVITSVSGIDSLVTDDSSRFDVYDITGIMLRKNADKEYVRHLSKGVYIIVYGNQFIKLNLTGK